MVKITVGIEGMACGIDTPLKVKKYIHCGMRLCGEKKLKHSISLYTMAYNVPAGKRDCI